VQIAPDWEKIEMRRSGHMGGERGVEPGPGIDDAETVRPQHPHPVSGAELDQLLLEGRPFVADLAKAGGDDDGRLDLGPDGVIQYRQHRGLRYDHDRQIHLLPIIGQRRETRQAEDAVGRRIDRDQPAGKAALDQVGEDVMTDLAGLPRGPDHRHGCRTEQFFQITGPFRLFFGCIHG